VKWTIHRPCHDHNNSPNVELKIPPKGAQECECGKHEERNAELTIESNSGHLKLATFFKNYVWYRRARFYIPKGCWRGEDQKP